MAIEAGELLQHSMQRKIWPVSVIAKPPQLLGLNGGKTQLGPMRELLDEADAIMRSSDYYKRATAATTASASASCNSGARDETFKNVLKISLCAGFTAADIYDIGKTSFS